MVDALTAIFHMKRILFSVVFCFLPAMVLADKVALVIGNANYQHVSNLKNPSNDAIDIAEALRRIGFEVTTGLDLDYRDMRLAIRDFGEKAKNAESVIVYFAGHGIELDNTNFLIPVSAELRSDRDIELEAIRLNTLISSIAGAPGLKIVLVDACRNNPFLATMERTNSTRSIGRGLARIDPGGVLVGYAARSGTLALDGDGRNSPYAQALLNHIEEPGLEIGKLFRRVRDRVYTLTEGYQEPFTYGSLPARDIFLVPDAAAGSTPEEEIERVEDQIYADFELARSLGRLDAIEMFLERYEGERDHFAVALALSLRDDLLAEHQKDEVPGNSSTARDKVAALVPTSPQSAKDDTETRSLIRDIQTELNRVGCSAGTADGVAGPRTRSAFSRYISARENLGLTPESLETSETLAALRGEQGRVCNQLVAPSFATFDGDYIVLIRRRWDDDYWQTTSRPDKAYFPGKIEPLAALRINRNGDKLTLLSAQGFAAEGPWFRDFTGKFDDSGQLKLRFTLSSHFGQATPYKVNISVKLPEGLSPGRRIVYEPRRIDGQFFLNFLIRRVS